MPKVFDYNGYRFFFFSNEGKPLEPVHIHVKKGDGQAKVWVIPAVELAECQGFSPSEVRMILEVVQDRYSVILEAWHAYFG